MNIFIFMVIFGGLIAGALNYFIYKPGIGAIKNFFLPVFVITLIVLTLIFSPALFFGVKLTIFFEIFIAPLTIFIGLFCFTSMFFVLINKRSK